MDKIEIRIIKNAAKNTSFKECKECKYFSLVDKRPACSFDGTTVDDCQLASKPIN
jgi:hypothetical protein